MASVFVDTLTPLQQLDFLHQEASYRRELDRLKAEIDLLKECSTPACRCPSPDSAI
jgi:hypothetical protein